MKVGLNPIMKHDTDISTARCSHCGKFSIWVNEKLAYPALVTAPRPNQDLPPDVLKDYEEARLIEASSPRAATALLRLAIQKLCRHLGEPGHNINSDIAELVKKGLPLRVQQALDLVRVVGNSAVHPGQIDLEDDPAVVSKLFGLVNLVADVMITQPKHVEELYGTVIPDNLKAAINRRDGK